MAKLKNYEGRLNQRFDALRAAMQRTTATIMPLYLNILKLFSEAVKYASERGVKISEVIGTDNAKTKRFWIEIARIDGYEGIIKDFVGKFSPQGISVFFLRNLVIAKSKGFMFPKGTKVGEGVKYYQDILKGESNATAGSKEPSKSLLSFSKLENWPNNLALAYKEYMSMGKSEKEAALKAARKWLERMESTLDKPTRIKAGKAPAKTPKTKAKAKAA